jgi:hypothetical protein
MENEFDKKRKIKQKDKYNKDFTNTILSMELLHIHFLQSAKAFCSFAMAEA